MPNADRTTQRLWSLRVGNRQPPLALQHVRQILAVDVRHGGDELADAVLDRRKGVTI
jgi:hypothetical protein